MKHTTTSKIAAVAVLTGLISAAPSAQALSLIYETGPLTGQAFNMNGNNPIAFKFTGFATGEVYGPGPTVGFSGPFNPNAPTVGQLTNLQNGIAAIDLLPTPGTANIVMPSMVQTIVGGVPQGNMGTEDQWSIARVTSIVDSVTGDTIWSQGNKLTQLTALIAGGKDFYKVTTPAQQTINAVGVRLDFFEVSTAGFPNLLTYNPAAGPGAGHGGDSVGAGSIVAGVTNGAPILTLRSAPGFINPDGINGGLAAEFESNLNLTGSGGNGSNSQAFFDVVGGTLASLFNTNKIQSGVVGGRTQNADLQAQFTQTSFGFNIATGQPVLNPNGWGVFVNDPITAFPIPEPATALFGVACMLPLLSGRQRKKIV